MSFYYQFLLSVQDEAADDEALRAILTTLAAELDQRSAEVNEVSISEAQAKGMIAKGEDKSSSLLDVKINLDTLKTFGKWLYDRLLGSTTKATFEYEGQKFTFDGRKEELDLTMQAFEKYVATIEAAKKAKNG